MDGNEQEQALAPVEAPEASGASCEVYRNTADSMDDLLRKFDYYGSLLDKFRKGNSKAELRKRYMLKAIDEVWVRAIEDTLPSLDTIIRNPGMLLQEHETILNIEQTKKVTSRSIQHLSQHTDYINDIKKDGTVIPSKLLNVFQDETMLTYENKFINTLLNNLYVFVARRYEGAKICGEDEKNTCLDLTQEFTEKETTGKIHLTIEVSERPQENEVVKNYVYTTDLWKRVEKIYNIVTKYMGSDFARQMGKTFIRPPVMRTNKLLKNVDFRQCLSLWEFIQSYENTGYETLIQEDLEDINEDCLADFYHSVSMQYVLFRHHIRNEFDEEKVLDAREIDDLIKPQIVNELDPFNEREFDVTDLVPDKAPETELKETGEENEIEEAIRIALEADALFAAEEADNEETAVIEDGAITYRYKYSFLARLIFAQDPTQDFYTQIKNELLSYQKVKSRISWNHEAFNAGRTKCAKINVKGKTLYLYLPLDPNEYSVSKYHHVDVSDSKKTQDVPFLLKVRSNRGVKYAKELIAIVMANYGLSKLEQYEYTDYHLPYATAEELAHRIPQLVRIIGEDPLRAEELTPLDLPADMLPEDAASPEGFTYHYKYSFLARLIFAQNPTQDYYTAVKNELLAYKHVKSRISWGHETFNAGRTKCAKINVKGKTLYLYLPLDPNEYSVSKYHHVDVSDSKKTQDVPFLLKVRSNRGVKYAKELIAIVMANYGLSKLEHYEYTDYHLPYATAEELAHRIPQLVRIIGEEWVPDVFEEPETVAEIPTEEAEIPAEETETVE